MRRGFYFCVEGEMIDLRKRALENPEKPAYIMGESNEVITNLQLEERANQCAHMFRDLGLGIGDHIAHGKTPQTPSQRTLLGKGKKI
jgi:hypothetical protein